MKHTKRKNRVIGDCRQRQVEVRYDDRGDLDEIVAFNATVHLERMNDSQFYIGVTTQKDDCRFFIGATRAAVSTVESSRDPINHRSVAARRRENRKRHKTRTRA